MVKLTLGALFGVGIITIAVAVLNAQFGGVGSMTIASPSATRYYFQLYVGNDAEPTAVGYLGTGDKMAYVNFPIYDEKSVAAKAHVEMKKIKGIQIESKGRHQSHPMQVLLDGETKPISAFLKQGTLFTDRGLIMHLSRFDERVILKRAENPKICERNKDHRYFQEEWNYCPICGGKLTK